MNLRCAYRDQALNLVRLTIGIEVEVEARRDLQSRANLVEREVRADPVRRTEENEIVALSVVSADIAQRGLPELGLKAQIIDAQNDRADTEHRGRY